MGESHSRWIRELSAASPKRATHEQRARFAAAVLEQLSEAYTRGERAQSAWKRIQCFHNAAREIRSAVQSFATAISSDSIHAARIGLTLDEFDDVTQPVLRFIIKVHSIEDGFDSRDRPYLTLRSGRKTRIAIEVAEMIAYEYDRCFGKIAGRSKQAAKNTPFLNLCKVVERILDERGVTGISLGQETRREGIDRACTAILQEMSGAPPGSILVADNVRALLLHRRRMQGGPKVQSSALRRWGDLPPP